MNSTVVESLLLFLSHFQETYQAANVSTILLTCENALAVQSLVSLMSKPYPSVMAQWKLSNERLSLPDLNGHGMVLPPHLLYFVSCSCVYLLCVCVYRRRRWHPTPVLLPGKSHGQRGLVGCGPWGCEELDTTERLYFHFSLSCIGGGNGNPLQCSCLENPRDGGACRLPSMGSHRVGHD